MINQVHISFIKIKTLGEGSSCFLSLPTGARSRHAGICSLCFKIRTTHRNIDSVNNVRTPNQVDLCLVNCCSLPARESARALRLRHRGPLAHGTGRHISQDNPFICIIEKI